MKRILVIGAAVPLLLSITSCDLLRTLAGRPTSKDIEAKRAMIEKERQLKEQRQRDSAARVAAQLEAAAAAAAAEAAADAPEQKTATQVNGNFRIILGTFADKSNATRLSSQAVAAGYDAVILQSSTGRSTVAVRAGATEKEAQELKEKLKKEPFCPAGVWIQARK